MTVLAVEGMVDNRPRIFEESEAIDIDNSASVMSFAQREMVTTFMEGINADLRSYMASSTEGLFRGLVDVIIDQVQQSHPKAAKILQAKVSPGLDELLRQLFEAWQSMSKERFWGPIIDVVASLPKDELAGMAEALVNLTKFKRRVSPEEESVAGPIDVAIITKGDGFVWVKRKHYFDPALNPRFMSKYSMEGK
jgi:hypothetical protein